MLNQKGNVQTKMCIPQYQNSGTQGPLMSRIVHHCGMKKNNRVLVRLEGGCSRFAKRAEPDGAESGGTGTLQRRETIQISTANATLRDPYGDGSLTYVAVDLGELEDGHYDLRLDVGGRVDNVTVLDSGGDAYAVYASSSGRVRCGPFVLLLTVSCFRSVQSPTGQSSVSFHVDNGLALPMALIAYTNKAVKVSHSGTGQIQIANGTGTSTTATGSAQPQPTRSGSSVTGPGFNSVSMFVAVVLFHEIIVY